MIDLVSDTATHPCAGMRAAIARAEVGDEQRGEDPSVNALCARVADLLGFEAAVLLPSGIMSNLIAILVHCRPGDEVICAANAHIVGSEGGGPSAIAGVQLATIDTPDGRFSPEQFAGRIRRKKARAPRAALVSIEQTSNAGGGTCWSLAALSAISAIARDHGCAMHMDGARLLNASVATGRAPAEDCRYFQSAWLDLSKGLGCPIGSVLVGSRDFIEAAWVWKHRLGGAMRQSGIIAAAGLYALDHNVVRLAEDHANARVLAGKLRDIPGVTIVGGPVVETNIVFVDVTDTGKSAEEVASQLAARGVRMGVAGEMRLRAVTHLGISSGDVAMASAAFAEAVTA